MGGSVILRQRYSRRTVVMPDPDLFPKKGRKPVVDVLLKSYLLDEWLPQIKLEVEPTTYSSLVHNVHSFIVPHLGSFMASELTGEIIRSFHRELLSTPVQRGSGTLSKNSVIRIHATLSWALQRLVEAARIPFNPAWNVKPRLKKSERFEPTTWNPTDVIRFIKFVSKDDHHALWVLLILTGVRRGEALGLQWGDLSPDCRKVAIKRTLNRADRSTYLSGTKGAHGRNIDLTPQITNALRRHRRRCEKSRSTNRLSLLTDRTFIFTDVSGEPLNPVWVSKRFQKIIAEGDFPKIRLHDLRHTHATHLLQAGANIKAVQERLGHTDMVVTMETYVHVMPTVQAEALKALRKLYQM